MSFGSGGGRPGRGFRDLTFCKTNPRTDPGADSALFIFCMLVLGRILFRRLGSFLLLNP
jgi:hypothetical protein